MLANNLLAADRYGVVEVIALDIAAVQVGDVETALSDILERRAVIGVDCSERLGQYIGPWESSLNVLPVTHVRTYRV